MSDLISHQKGQQCADPFLRFNDSPILMLICLNNQTLFWGPESAYTPLLASLIEAFRTAMHI